MAAALSLELPLTLNAVDELELTTTSPGTLMLALPESVRAPLAVGLSTKMEGATTIDCVTTPFPPMTSVTVSVTR